MPRYCTLDCMDNNTIHTIKNLFITGERDAGKSTAIEKALALHKPSITGFVTRPYEINGHVAGHYIHSLSDQTPLEQNDKPINIIYPPGKSIAIEPSFEIFGVAYLRQAMRDNRPIIMDELGILERHVRLFTQTVFQCLDGPQPVLGALRLCQGTWLDQIKCRRDTKVLTVTLQNREEILQTVLQFVQRWGTEGAPVRT